MSKIWLILPCVTMLFMVFNALLPNNYLVIFTYNLFVLCTCLLATLINPDLRKLMLEKEDQVS